MNLNKRTSKLKIIKKKIEAPSSASDSKEELFSLENEKDSQGSHHRQTCVTEEAEKVDEKPEDLLFKESMKMNENEITTADAETNINLKPHWGSNMNLSPSPFTPPTGSKKVNFNISTSMLPP